MELNDLKSDLKKESEGVWCSFDDDTQFLIGKINSKLHRDITEKFIRPKRAMIKRNLVSDKELTNINAEIVSQSILLDWKGLMIDGKEIKYSREVCKNIWLDESLASFREWIEEHAVDTDIYKLEIEKHDEGSVEDLKK